MMKATAKTLVAAPQIKEHIDYHKVFLLYIYIYINIYIYLGGMSRSNHGLGQTVSGYFF